EGSKIYGVISILIQIHYEGHYLFTVDKSKFTPPPKVQSAVIRMVRREKSLIDADHESLLKRIVKISFSQRRKMIKNTIKTIIGANGILEEPFFKKRPEQLSVDQFIELTHRIKEILNQNN
ncbi:MAG: rRNA adenine N-6-methyltransferase family protein, partial [Bacteroidota bacterium]